MPNRCHATLVVSVWNNLVPAAMVLQASNEELDRIGRSARGTLTGVRSHLKQAWNALTEARLTAEAIKDLAWSKDLASGKTANDAMSPEAKLTAMSQTPGPTLSPGPPSPGSSMHGYLSRGVLTPEKPTGEASLTTPAFRQPRFSGEAG